MKARLLVVTALMSLLVAACGGAAAPAPASTAAPAPAANAAPTAFPTTPVPPLKVAVTSLTIGNAPIYVAIAEGFFKKYGLEVTTFDAASTNLLNLVVSGQADLGQGSNTNALTATAQGKPMKVLYNYQGNAAGGFLAGKNEYTSAAQIKKVGSGGPGTSIFGYCNFFKAQIKATWDCIPMADYTTRKAAFLAGQIDGVMDVYPQLYDMVEKNQAKPLIDVRVPAERRKYMTEDIGEAGIWGLATTLTAKRESVIRFMKGIGDAMEFMDKSSDRQVAQSVKKLPQFGPNTEDVLTKQEELYRAFNYPNKGYISEAVWKYSLTIWAQWGLGAEIDSRVSQPVFNYASMVDMSFYEQSIGKPK